MPTAGMQPEMELWTPIRAHAEWIAMFRESLYGRAAWPPSLLEDDTACEVGRWLSRYESSLGHLNEYRHTRDIHAQFHRRAGHCLRLAESGRRLEALADTEPHGELRRLSRLLVASFRQLKHLVRQHALPVSWDISSEGDRRTCRCGSGEPGGARPSAPGSPQNVIVRPGLRA
jgi:hypothetical protein